MKRLPFVITLVLCITNFQPAAVLQTACTGISAPLLKAGKYAYVLPTPATPLPVRTIAGVSERIFATLAPGTQFKVLDGPTCASGSWWWHIQNRQFQLTGWIPEGDKVNRFVEPVADSGMLDLTTTTGPSGIIAFMGVTDVDATGHPISDVYLTTADGSHRIQLTYNADVSGRMSWSPDGKQLAFFGLPQSSPGGIFAINANGSNWHWIMPFGYTNPNWTPDGKQIVAGYLHDNKSHISRFDLQTSQSSDFDLGLDYQYISCPALSPDGQHIAFVAGDSKGVESIYIWDSTAASSVKVARGSCPAWSPDSKRIAFTQNTPTFNGGVIFAANADGTGLSKLFETTQNYGYGSLAWSPSGEYIVYSVLTTPNQRNVPDDWTLALIPVGTALNDSNTKPFYLTKGVNPVWVAQTDTLTPTATDRPPVQPAVSIDASPTSLKVADTVMITGETVGIGVQEYAIMLSSGGIILTTFENKTSIQHTDSMFDVVSVNGKSDSVTVVLKAKQVGTATVYISVHGETNDCSPDKPCFSMMGGATDSQQEIITVTQ